MANIGSLIIRIGANLDDLNQGIEESQGIIGKAGSFMQNAFSFAIGGLIEKGISAIGSSVGGLASQMIDSNAAFEDYETRFKVLLGSAEAAKERMADLATFGATTPFELPEVVQADLVLQGFGLHSAEAAKKFGYSGEEIRTIAGDVASGTGQSFAEMANLLGRFSSGSTGEAIMRMQELGIATREQLAGMGLQFSKSGQLLSPLPEAMNVVLTLMKQKYGGLMDEQSHTFNGMMSNLNDWKDNTLRVIGQPIFEVLKGKLQNLLDFLNSPGVQETIQTLTTGLASGIDIVLGGVETLFSYLSTGDTKAFETLVSKLTDLFGPEIGAGLSSLIAHVREMWEAIKAGDPEAFSKALSGAINIAVGMSGSLLGQLIGTIKIELQNRWPDISQELSTWPGKFWNWITGADGATSQTPNALSQITTAINTGLEQNWPLIDAQLNTWAGMFWNWITNSVLPAAGEKLDQLTATINTWSSSPETQQELNQLGQNIGGGLIDGMVYLIENTDKIAGVGWKLVSKLFSVSIDLSGSLGDIGGEIGSGMITGIIEKITGAEVSEELSNAIETVIRTIINTLNPVAMIQESVEQAQQNWSNASNLLGYATGGVVPGPVGAAQLAVVHGGEQVIPARQSAFTIGSIIINASTEEGGKAAGRGFVEELRSRGLL